MSGALTLALAQGTYLSTTMALSRHERLAVAGLGVRARATMVVDDSAVRWECQGANDVRVARSRLLEVRLERRLAGSLLGRAPVVLVSWTADSGTNDIDNDDIGTKDRDTQGSDTNDIDANDIDTKGIDTKGSDKNELAGGRYVTSFLPRSRADSEVLVSAVQRLMKMRVSTNDAPMPPDGNP